MQDRKAKFIKVLSGNAGDIQKKRARANQGKLFDIVTHGGTVTVHNHFHGGKDESKAEDDDDEDDGELVLTISFKRPLKADDTLYTESQPKRLKTMKHKVSAMCRKSIATLATTARRLATHCRRLVFPRPPGVSREIPDLSQIMCPRTHLLAITPIATRAH